MTKVISVCIATLYSCQALWLKLSPNASRCGNSHVLSLLRASPSDNLWTFLIPQIAPFSFTPCAFFLSDRCVKLGLHQHLRFPINAQQPSAADQASRAKMHVIYRQLPFCISPCPVVSERIYFSINNWLLKSICCKRCTSSFHLYQTIKHNIKMLMKYIPWWTNLYLIKKLISFTVNCN